MQLCNSINSEINHCISIIHINARSLIHNIDDIIQLLDSIQNKCIVIVITET